MSDEANYGVIVTEAKLAPIIQHVIDGGQEFGFDIETGYTGSFKDKCSLRNNHPDWLLVGFSFAGDETWARYVPLAHDDGNNFDDTKAALRLLWKLLATGRGVAHNLSFELRNLSYCFEKLLSDDPEVGAEIRASQGFFPFRSDSMVEAFLTGRYHPNNPGQDLKSLVKHCFQHEMIKLEELQTEYETGKARQKAIRFNPFPVNERVVRYACEDSVWALKMHHRHYPEVSSGDLKLVYQIEMALIPIWVRMEREGLWLDWVEVHKKLSLAEHLRLKFEEEIQQEFSDRLGRPVNINLGSTKQLGKLLFEDLGLPVRIRSEKTNNPSTSEKALRPIAQLDATVRKLLQYREVETLISNYLKRYDQELSYAVDPATLTGRGYPSHKSTGAGTGRASVDDVSYQQWPKPYHYELADGTVFDLNFRNLLLCPPGTRGIGFDYSQVELRVLAGVANEQNMLEAFRTGQDIHRATASRMLGIPIERVTKKERAIGKTCNFAVVYGSGPENIAELLSTPEHPVTKADAEVLLQNYFDAFPNIKKWLDESIRFGKEKGFVWTPFMRKFTVWEYTSTERWLYAKGDRMCGNAPIQGGAADYCKLAMVRVDKAIRNAGMQDKIKMFMMIHDALEFYVHESVPTQDVIALLTPAVSYPFKDFPEITADWHEWTRWGEPVEIKLDENDWIHHYAIEDVDKTFATVEEAYAHWRGEEAGTEVPDERVEFDLTVTLAQMPTAESWTRFKNLLSERPGTGDILLITPQGMLPMQGVTSMQPIDQPVISEALDGATVSFRRKEFAS